MLTWINENAKWVIAIFAVGIVLGLLAMDRTPSQAHQYPIGRVDGEAIPYPEYNIRVKKIVDARYKGEHLEDEQYAKLRNDVFRSFVQQTLLAKQFEANGLVASVSEMKAELKNNPDVVRRMVGEEAQQRLYSIQANSSNEQEANQRIQAYIQTLPQFLVDSNFNKAAYDHWLETPEAYEWVAMGNYEQELKTMTIPVRQLQIFVTANVHPTSLEAEWNVQNRLTSQELEVAYAAAEDFAVDSNSVDSVMVNAYFNAHPDSFFVTKDEVRMLYAYMPLTPTKKDEDKVREYAMTLYYQLKDTSTVASFEDMAKVASEDVSTASAGGSLGDYTARGAWVKEFEDAAFALDSGEISEPVRTKYGYHIIQSHGKIKDSTGTEKVKVSHILLTVTASSETIDSLEQILTGIKTAVENDDKPFIDAASAAKVAVRKTGWISRDDVVPELGYVSGLSAYAFVNSDRPDLSEGKVSGVLKNKNFILVAMRTDSLAAGDRSVRPFIDQIRGAILSNKSAEAAAHYMTTVADKIQSVSLTPDSLDTASVKMADTSVAKVKIEKVTASFDGFVPGIGYSNPTLFKVLKQKVGEWGEPVKTDRGAAMVKVISRSIPDEAALKAAVAEELANTWHYGYSMVFNDYVNALESAAKVESNIDLYYRE
ncbi:MAG: peptidylprolyl isomerase [Fibrobacteraceae bacterium]